MLSLEYVHDTTGIEKNPVNPNSSRSQGADVKNSETILSHVGGDVYKVTDDLVFSGKRKELRCAV